MRICLLGSASSIHTVRWANGLSGRGHQVSLLSRHPRVDSEITASVDVVELPDLRATGYVTDAWAVRRWLRQNQPDVLNVHYASGYGLLARLARPEVPTLLSVWGSDIYDVPRAGRIQRHVITRNLHAATALASTSRCMAQEIRRYASDRTIHITPFGVDTQRFTPAAARASANGLVIGTVKRLDSKYGVDTLIEAFAKVVEDRPHVPLELHLYGGGPDEALLRRLARSLDVEEQTRFMGQVPHAEVPAAMSSLDVYVALSRLDSESFGVAILEAGAAARPVVVSNVAGPAEVTVDGVTGLIVPRDDSSAASEAIGRLIDDQALRNEMGTAGRRHVEELYSWERSLDLMETAYADTQREYRAHRTG